MRKRSLGALVLALACLTSCTDRQVSSASPRAEPSDSPVPVVTATIAPVTPRSVLELPRATLPPLVRPPELSKGPTPTPKPATNENASFADRVSYVQPPGWPSASADDLFGGLVSQHCPAIASPIEVDWSTEAAAFSTTTETHDAYMVVMRFADDASALAGHERISSFVFECFGSASSEPGVWSASALSDFLGELWGDPGVFAGSGVVYFGTLDEVVIGDAVGITYLRAEPDADLEVIYGVREAAIRQMLVGLHGVPPDQ